MQNPFSSDVKLNHDESKIYDLGYGKGKHFLIWLFGKLLQLQFIQGNIIVIPTYLHTHIYIKKM